MRPPGFKTQGTRHSKYINRNHMIKYDGSNSAFTTETETDKRWFIYSCVEVFILHRVTNTIGYCSHLIGFGLC